MVNQVEMALGGPASDVIDAPARQQLPARVEPAGVPAAPSIETTLAIAVEKGIDPASLEKLVALYERVADRRAAQAYAAALAAFKGDVGPILKRQEAYNEKSNKVMYRFADLEEITKTIDPVLLRHGLSYTFDSSMLDGLTVVKCTVRHVDGHKESSNFTCKGSGTPLMNAAQVSASAVTFGRRYALVLALGLTIDSDDDGRRAAPPNPAPEHDAEQPRVGTRQERQQQQAAPAGRVTAEELNTLFYAWRDRSGKEEGTGDQFVKWAAEVLKRQDVDALKSPAAWSREDMNKCGEVML